VDDVRRSCRLARRPSRRLHRGLDGAAREQAPRRPPPPRWARRTYAAGSRRFARGQGRDRRRERPRRRRDRRRRPRPHREIVPLRGPTSSLAGAPRASHGRSPALPLQVCVEGRQHRRVARSSRLHRPTLRADSPATLSYVAVPRSSRAECERPRRGRSRPRAPLGSALAAPPLPRHRRLPPTPAPARPSSMALASPKSLRDRHPYLRELRRTHAPRRDRHRPRRHRSRPRRRRHGPARPPSPSTRCSRPAPTRPGLTTRSQRDRDARGTRAPSHRRRRKIRGPPRPASGCEGAAGGFTGGDRPPAPPIRATIASTARA